MPDHRIEAELAPDIDARWAEDFILEARLLEVPGDRIGDALSEINSHCRDAGEEPGDAFGQPIQYARVIAAHTTAVDSPWLPLLGPTMLQMIGVVLALHGIGGWVTGDPQPLSWGAAGVLAIVAGAVPLLAMVLSRCLGFLARHTVLGILMGGTVTALLFAGSSILLRIDTPDLPLSPGATFLLGMICLAAGISADVMNARTGRLEDPITGPGTTPRPRKMRYLLAGSALIWLTLGTAAIILFAPRPV